jgi:hypothetical protein
LLQIGTRKIEREFGRMAWKSVFWIELDFWQDFFLILFSSLSTIL